jgi:hypothetical protein
MISVMTVLNRSERISLSETAGASNVPQANLAGASITLAEPRYTRDICEFCRQNSLRREFREDILNRID